MHSTNHHSNALATTYNPQASLQHFSLAYFSSANYVMYIHIVRKLIISQFDYSFIFIFCKLTIKGLRACARIPRAMRKLFS